jgi:hypothetical protein
MSRLKEAVTLDYFRPGQAMSPRQGKRVFAASRMLPMVGAIAACGMVFAAGAWAQYPGRVTKSTKAEPVLRSVAVLEWTGEAGKPSASRLVPVVVYDGEQLNDGTIYLSRPEPLALSSGVEYELQMAGKPVGVFDLFGAGEVEGAWRGFGAWKPMSAVAAAKAKQAFNTSSLKAGVDIPDDDKPVLKRKHPKEPDSDSSGTAKSGTASSGDAGTAKSTAPDADPDRPTLKRKNSTDSGSTDSASSKPAADADPDRPTLKRKPSDDSSSSGSGATSASGSKGTGDVDPDRPTIRRSRKNAAQDSGMLETALGTPDPDRPRLKRGKPADLDVAETPKLMGTPPTMQQAVAVSDASNRSEHPWRYSWANPEDEYKMKSALEDIARTALSLNQPAPAHKAPAAKTAAARKLAKPTPHAVPVELADEQFRVFELSYGSAATLVLTASTPAPVLPDQAKSAAESQPDLRPIISRGKKTVTSDDPPPATTTANTAAKSVPQKFVTLIAQPDLYGGIIVLYKSVTDAAHLDETPKMRLVDAVDAMGDNRGELLFELRSDTQRQFALYRVTRGEAQKLFATVSIP